MSDEVFFSKMITKGLEPIESDGRFFEGYLTVQVKDKQGEVTIVDELYKVLPIWMDRGAPITDTHSNRVIGKGINFARSDYTDSDGTIYPAIKVTGKIYKDYELDNEIWSKIKSGEYKGLSFGGSTKTDREPMRMKDGSIAYSLSKLEHYEVAVCKDPAVPLAVITDINPIAKSNMACDKTGCYVTKPILGEETFEKAKRKVQRESNVPAANAARIVGAAENKLASDVILPEQHLNLCKHCGLPKKSEGANEPEYHDESIIKGRTSRNRKRRKAKEAKVTAGMLGTFKSLVDTNKILNIYQGNVLPLARILDKVSLPVTNENTGEVTSEGTVAGTGRSPKKEKKLNEKQRHKLHFDRLRERKRQRYRPNEAKDRKNMIPTDTQIAGKKAKEEKEALALANLVAAKRRRQAEASGKFNITEAEAHRKRNLVGRGNKGRDRGRKISDIKEEPIVAKKSLFNKIYDKIKDAPKDIARPNQTGNVPAGKKKEPKGQSHGAQSTRERERGIIEQQDDSRYHYSKPQSMSEHRKLVPHEEIGAPEHLLYEDVTSDSQADSMRARRPYESMLKPNAILADPRKRKSLFDKIKEDIAKKN